MARRRIRNALHALRESPPGDRFEEAHERSRIGNPVARMVVIGIGSLMLVSGAVTFWLPGPNFVIVLAGLAIVAGQWRMVARALDRLEIAARRWNDEHWDPYPHKLRVKVLGMLGFVAVAGLLGWFAERQGWLPGWLPLVS